MRVFALGCLGVAVVLGAFASHKTPAQSRQAEVVLLGGSHTDHLFDPEYSPIHLRALLQKTQPDVIAIENLPQWQARGKYYWLHMPEYYVALGHSREHGTPVVGVDWQVLPPEQQSCARPESPPDTAALRAGMKKGYDLIRQIGSRRAQQVFSSQAWSIDTLYMHDNPWAELPSWQAWARDSLAKVRDDKIAENIGQLAERFLGRRIVVILGSFHLYPQTIRLRRNRQIRLLPARQFLPLTEEDVGSALRLTDLHMMLGASLDGWSLPGIPHTRDHRRTGDLLGQLNSLDSASALTRYYVAKWHLLFGRHEQAANMLDTIIAEHSADSISYFPSWEWSWPPWQRVHYKAMFARATIHDLQQEHDRAIHLYQVLLRSVPDNRLRPRYQRPFVYWDLKWYLESLISDSYRGGMWEAYRAQQTLVCWPRGAIPMDVWPN